MKVEELQAGMYVMDTGLSWLENPYLYAQEGEIASREQVERILADGFVDVFVDPGRGSYAFSGDQAKSGVQLMSEGLAPCSPEQARQESPPVSCSPDAPVDVRQKHEAFRAELAQARKVYAESMRFVKSFMDGARNGYLMDFHAADRFVGDVIDSIMRSDDALVSLTKLKSFDEYTYTHCLNVAVLAVAFGKHLSLPRAQLNRLGMAGLFHDLGKQRIPEAVLNKPGKLTPEEFEIIKSHPERGHALFKSVKGVADDVLQGIVEHHEKHNGAGYPQGLRGEEIHQFGRVLAVVDVYDALTSARVYKPGMLPSKALSILYNMRGADFTPGMAERFIKHIGIFPVGSLVRLSDFSHGVVVAANPDAPLTPLVKVVFNERLRPRPPELVDLAEERDAKGARARKIVDCLDPQEAKVDVTPFLA